ncbi:MAG: type II toxin-antitoxin system VapB family antitoxin [Burkholderiaceae bacterium]|nr:type II toxin-antitoxin system VapB family antitoxin [Burkholderiaceae bacterium]
MRTNIDIDDDLLAAVMAAGLHRTKKDAVEAGLRLLLRQAAYQELLKWEGKLPWGWGDEPELEDGPVDAAAGVAAHAAPAPAQALAVAVAEPATAARRKPGVEVKRGRR